MMMLRQVVHPDVKDVTTRIYERTAARAIILKGSKILLIYTKRYDDYTVPGGGVDLNEDVETALFRELKEETGAQNIKIVSFIGSYDEKMPTYRDGYDAMHMLSHFYLCSADEELGEATPESYEIANGSVPVWVELTEAIEHNEAVIKSKADSMGYSIERETFILKKIYTEKTNSMS